jgi:precorrin-6B methylase 2
VNAIDTCGVLMVNVQDRRGGFMTLRRRCGYLACLLFALPAALASQRPAEAVRQERQQAAREVPQLAEVLAVKPGMIVADVGAGGGAMSVAMAKWLGAAGRVYSTDIGAEQLAEIRAAVAEDTLSNVVVLEGAAASTNLPGECCDAIFLRDVYHHLTKPDEFDASLMAALKRGGRLAVMDFPPDPGSAIPAGVPANRGGHGIPVSILVTELTRAGFTHLNTMSRWPPDDNRGRLFLALFEKG